VADGGDESGAEDSWEGGVRGGSEVGFWRRRGICYG